MPRALKICSCSSCPAHAGPCVEATPSGRCIRCVAAAEQRRGSAAARGYDHHHRRDFAEVVLDRDVMCTIGGCGQPSEHADHWPLDRDELVRQGLDPNDPKHGRGLCGPHHSSETARHQPGGWNTRWPNRTTRKR